MIYLTAQYMYGYATMWYPNYDCIVNHFEMQHFYSDVIMDTMTSHITSLTIVFFFNSMMTSTWKRYLLCRSHADITIGASFVRSPGEILLSKSNAMPSRIFKNYDKTRKDIQVGFTSTCKHFQIHFPEWIFLSSWKPLNFKSNDTEICPLWSTWQQVSIGAGNGLASIGVNSLPAAISTKICDATWRH